MSKAIVLLTLVFWQLLVAPGIGGDCRDSREEILQISSFRVSARTIADLCSEAIDRSFRNIAQGKAVPGFPDTPGPRNTPFLKEPKYEYRCIIGYEYSLDNPRFVTFGIGPKLSGDMVVKGDHLAVEVDLETMTMVRVYNFPGS